MKWAYILLFVPSLSFASGIYNPGAGGGGSSLPLPAGDTNYIQNTLTPTTTTQVFSVQQGEYSLTGFIMTDINGCTWNTTINATGSLNTTLISCGGSTVGTYMGFGGLTYAN